MGIWEDRKKEGKKGRMGVDIKKQYGEDAVVFIVNYKRKLRN